MTDPEPTPALARGIAALPAHLLPPGRFVAPETGGPANYWLSDDLPAPSVWARLRSEHPHTGLWPVLLGPLGHDANRPWVDGEVSPDRMTGADHFDAATILADRWRDCVGEEEDDDLVTAPFGLTWPGPAPAGALKEDPTAFAGEYAEVISGEDGVRIGLVPAGRGADALTALGWTGPCNYSGTGEISAVVRTWEERFGAVVVMVGFDTLYLSVAAPPVTEQHALHVAAEHFAICPDNVWQGEESLEAYAVTIRDAPNWVFWWD